MTVNRDQESLIDIADALQLDLDAVWEASQVSVPTILSQVQALIVAE